MTRSVLLAALTPLVALILPASSVAGVTSSTVTTPAATVTRVIDGTLPASDPSSRLLVAGTAAGLPGDEVDIRCARRDPDGTVNLGDVFEDGVGIPIIGGSFSQDVSLANGQRGCRIVATPTTLMPPDVTPFTGPKIFSTATNAFTISGGPNAGLISNFYAGAGRPTLDVRFFSIGGGGAPADTAPVDDSGDLPYYAQPLWGGNAALRGQSTKPGETRSQLQVDGINAFAPDVASGLTNAPGLRPITIDDISVDPATGDLTHVSTEPFVTCPTDGGANVTAADAGPATCPVFLPSGVAVRRTVVVRAATRSVETKDRWISTDGKSHDIAALYNQAQRSEGADGYRFPWVDGSTFRTHAEGDEVVPAPGRVASIFVKVKADSPDDDPRYTQGSLTLSTRPDLIRFTAGWQFELGFRRTVPASGALAIDQRFTVGTKRAVVENLAAQMEAAATAGLAVAITSATRVSGYDPAYTISGTTTAQGGVKSLIVNGASVTPAADGSWSARVQLSPGANPLSATVTDNNGDSATTASGVTFAPGPAQSALLKGSVRKGVLSATVRCQTLPGATCSGKLKLTARFTRVKRTRHGRRRSTKTVTLATRSFRLPAGDRAVPTVRLGRATRKLVRKYHIKRATLTLTQNVGGVTKTTRSSVPISL